MNELENHFGGFGLAEAASAIQVVKKVSVCGVWDYQNQEAVTLDNIQHFNDVRVAEKLTKSGLKSSAVELVGATLRLVDNLECHITFNPS